MKRSLVALAMFSVISVVSAQSHPYAMVKSEPVAQVSAPEWFTRMPQDTPDMLFAAGTAVSVDEQMAYDKARLQAERKLVEMMSSRVKSLVKSSRSDNGDTMTESTSVAVQKMAEGDLIGAQRVDSQATFDGKRYKVYVLLRYPLAENNSLRKEREAAQARKEGELRAARAHQELEAQSRQRQAEQAEAERKLKEEIGPKAEGQAPAPAAVPVSGAKAAQEVPVKAAQGEGLVGQIKQRSVELLDVDNAEYKKRREEALKKNGAVIGHTTISE